MGSRPTNASYQDALRSVALDDLMRVTDGRNDIVVAILDGPVNARLSAFAGTTMYTTRHGKPEVRSSVEHATAVAAVLAARRESVTPGICPNCTFVLHPLWPESGREQGGATTPRQLGEAIVDCIDRGARIVNLSAGLDHPFGAEIRHLTDALTYAGRRGAIVVAAAGNEGTIYSSPITKHSAVIPVAAFDVSGKPLGFATLSRSIALHGVGAPGEGIAGLRADGTLGSFTGSSVATPLVTGCIALLWSVFPGARAGEIKAAVRDPTRRTGRSVVPPFLDAARAAKSLSGHRFRRAT